MRTGVAISAVCHAGIVAACVVALPFGKPLEAPPEDLIPIELVTIDEVTQVARGEEDGVEQAEVATLERDVRQIDISRDAERETETPTESAAPPPPAPEPAPQEAAEPAPEPEPEPEVVAEPDPEPVEPEMAEPAPEPEIAEPAPEPEPSEEEVAVEDVPTPPARPIPPPRQPQEVAEVRQPEEPARQPEPQDPLQQIIEVDEAARREPAPDTPPAPDAPSFDADRIAALLNRAEPTAATAPEEMTAPTASIGQTSAFDAGLSMTEIDALRQQISRCWNLPAGAAGAEMLIVKLSIQLNPDGSLTADPELVDVTQSPFSQVAAEAAMRAVAGCQPYALPAEKYESWRHIVINFDPRAMLGG